MFKKIISFIFITKQLFTLKEYGVGDELPKGTKLSDLDSVEVSRSKLLINLVSLLSNKNLVRKL